MEFEEVKGQLEALKGSYMKQRNTLTAHLDPEQLKELGIYHKEIDHVSSFTANGVKYLVHTALAIERFIEFEKLQIQVGYGVDFRNLFHKINEAFHYLNNGLPADAAVVLHNVMKGVADNLEERENPVLNLCTLYICREDEDLTTYDYALNQAKIDDWKKEGISIDSFFVLAFNLVNGFQPIYKKVSQSISDHVQNVRDEILTK